MTAPAPPFTRDLSGNGTGCNAAETSPSASPRALGGNPFNEGFRVLWHCAGEPVFRDETGTIRPISLTTLRELRRALWTMARETTGRQRDRLCTLWAEADEALTDTVRWRQAACGIFLIREQVA